VHNFQRKKIVRDIKLTSNERLTAFKSKVPQVKEFPKGTKVDVDVNQKYCLGSNSGEYLRLMERGIFLYESHTEKFGVVKKVLFKGSYVIKGSKLNFSWMNLKTKKVSYRKGLVLGLDKSLKLDSFSFSRGLFESSACMAQAI
jgi:hypothetical protein